MALVAGCVAGSRQTYEASNPLTGGVFVTKDASPKGLQIGEIKDGTSKTILICESKQEQFAFWFSGRAASTIAMPPDLAQCNRIIRNKRIDGFPQPAEGVPSGLNYGRRDDAPRTNKPDIVFEAKFPNKPRGWGPSSQHAAGIVNHAYVDGHVKGISDGIEAKNYYRLVTRAGSEPTDG